MALSEATAIAQIRDLLATVTGMVAVYAPSETDENAIPEAFGVFPVALVLPGEVFEYILGGGMHRKTYEVRVQVFASPAGSLGQRLAAALPYVDRVIELFVLNVTLGGRANYCLFERGGAIGELEWGGVTYGGFEVVLRVSETASAAPAVGS